MGYDEGEAMAQWAQVTAARIIWGPVDGALLDAQEVSEKHVGLLSKTTAERALAWSVGRDGIEPGVHMWPGAQRGMRELARIPGALSTVLAHAFFDCCLREPLEGPPVGIEPETMSWLLDEIPDRIGWLVDYEGDLFDADPASPITQERFVLAALFDLEGQAGAEWMVRMLERHDIDVNFTYQDMRTGKRPPWSPASWVARLDALSAAAIDPRPGILTVFGVGGSPPPVETAPAQVRVALAYATSLTDPLLRTVGTYLAEYATGEPSADVGLFDWDTESDRLPLLRRLLEMNGPPGYRQRLVTCAEERGLVEPATASELGAAAERPAWIDGDVPWTVEEVVDLGVLRVPTGRIAGADPFWAFEGVYWAVDTGPSLYSVRCIVAQHPLHGRANAALEVMLDPEPEVAEWRPVASDHPHSPGYVAASAAGIADADLMADIPDDLLDRAMSDRLFMSETGREELDAGPAGNVWVIATGPQTPDCLSWTGHDREGRLVRLLTDLGVLDVDPVARPLGW